MLKTSHYRLKRVKIITSQIKFLSALTDPIALAVAFSGNLEAKTTNIYRRYSGYLISLKMQISKFRSRVLSAILFSK